MVATGTDLSRRYHILRLLADGGFHSGEALAESTGISRAAVWKHISTLKELLEVDIYAVRGKGYRLAEPIEMLDRRLIKSHLSAVARASAKRIEILDTINSTNHYLMEMLSQGIENGHTCFAEQQKSGRGRRGRTWISPFGRNIYLSIHWCYLLSPARLSGASLAAGVAVIHALEQLGVTGLGLKWPNDIMWSNRKLAGLLLEVSGEQSGPSHLILGLGLNTKITATEASAIDQPWVDLSAIPGGSSISRNRLAAILLESLLDMLSRFEVEGLSEVRKVWHQYDIYLGKAVTLLLGEKRIYGIYQGIDDSGAVLINQNGNTVSFYGGEVSLRASE